jgi:hypothetical protein
MSFSVQRQWQQQLTLSITNSTDDRLAQLAV